MKNNDIAVLAGVVVFSAIVSILLSNLLFSSGHDIEKVEVAPKISSSFPAPDDRFFNKDAIDPTRTITISPTTVTDPFTTRKQ